MRLSGFDNRRGGRRRGASAAELAFILPVLMLIVLGCVDFGRFAYHQVAVTNAARAGAGYAVMNPFLAGGRATWEAKVQEAARNEMANQTGSSPSKLTTTVEQVVDASGQRRVRVVAIYSSFETAVSWPGVPGRTTLRGEVVMPVIR